MYGTPNDGIDKKLTEYKYSNLLKRKKIIIKKETLRFPATFYVKLKTKLNTIEKDSKPITTKNSKYSTILFNCLDIAVERLDNQIKIFNSRPGTDISARTSFTDLPNLKCIN